MRLVSLALLAAWLGMSNAAHAAAVPWAGTLSLGDPGGGPSPFAFSGTGVATVNGSSGGIHLSELRLAGGITGTATIPLTDPENATLLSLRVEVTLGTGTLSPFAPPAPSLQPQLTQRTLPIRGRMRFCLISPGCVISVPLGFTANQGQSGVGIGGLVTVGGFGKGGGLAISLRAPPGRSGRRASRLRPAKVKPSRWHRPVGFTARPVSPRRRCWREGRFPSSPQWRSARPDKNPGTSPG